MQYKLLSICSLLVLTLSACGKGGNSAPSTPPVTGSTVSISSITDNRNTTNSSFSFYVSLDKVSNAPVTVNYTTADGTAKSNTDYKPVSGTLTIPANSSSASFDVTIIGDSTRKENQYFSVQISNPTNATMGTSTGTGTIVNENLLYFPVDTSLGYKTPTSYPGMTLYWSDEFNGKAVDKTIWTYETGAGGWGNNELENYTDRTQNSFVSNGNLIIEARQESLNGSKYTSARMITKNKKFFTFGRIDIRAKLPKGKGIWPALWMLGNNIDAVGWPTCGEMDIMELLGQEPNKVYGTLHWGSSIATHASKGGNYVMSTGSFDQQFHVYSLVWTLDNVQVYVDDILYNTITKSNVGVGSPFNSDFFFIFNVAVGGNWPGAPDATTVLPQRMVVDYVRVFK